MSEERQMYPVEPDILRFKLGIRMPYFHSILYSLKPTQQEGLKTFAVDPKGRWYFGAEVPFTPEEQLTALFHEINHLLRNHAGRMGDREHKQWNIAGDCEINDWFPPGFDIPQTIMFPSKFQLPDGEFAEWYYDRVDQYEAHVRVDATSLDPGSGPCETDPQCNSKDKPLDKDPNDHSIITKGVVHVPKCGGSGGQGNGDENERQDGDISPIEMEAIRKQVAEDIKQAGTAPGGLNRWAEEFLTPKVDWRRVLRTQANRAAVIIAGATDQTYQRPPRRSIKPFILPKKVAKRITTAFYIDTSGSMSEDDLKQAMGEVIGAVGTGVSDMTLTFVDAQVFEPTYKVTSKAAASLAQPKGGGGTNMGLCFEHAKTLRPKPNLIVVITDGITPWPAHQPDGGTQTIVCLSQEPHANYPVPPWARVVVMQ